MRAVKKYQFSFKKYPPCQICTKYCVKEHLPCYICKQNFHRSCLKLSKKHYENIKSKKTNFVCSNRCYNSELPFFTVDSIDMMSFLFGDKQYPCGKCDRECIGKIGRIWPSGNIASLSCSVCNKWYHFTCINLTEKEKDTV